MGRSDPAWRFDPEGENIDAVNQAYISHFEQAGLPVDTSIVGFPGFHEPGSNPAVPGINEACKTETDRDGFMCSFSKMVVRLGGRMHVYACTLVDNDLDYDLGGTLAEAMNIQEMLKHHRCYSCFAHGTSCSEI